METRQPERGDRPVSAAPAPHVVIVGGGFAGLYAARALRRAPVRVTVIDRRNHHLFQPLLYQVATGALNPADIANPIRSVLRKQANASVLLAEVTGIDVAARRVDFDGGAVDYDFLIVASGATHSYFGHGEWERLAPGLKTIDDALDIRRRVFYAYEKAEREADPAMRREWLTFVVVGGGPTGVELAGALSEIALHTLRRDFRSIDPTMARVILVEGQDRVLPPYPAELSDKARVQLEGLGVVVRTGGIVIGIDEHGVDLRSSTPATQPGVAPAPDTPAAPAGERIPARTVLWAAGVAASPLARTLGAPLDRAGRVVVASDLTVPGHPEVFVVGDLAAVRQSDGTPVPGVAPAAIQGGQHAARQIDRDIVGEPREPFHYRDKGSLATIGRAAAVADLGRVKLSGFLAWLAWWAIHIFFLIGFRSRVLVMFGWVWSYLTFQRGARLITGEVRELERDATGVRGVVPGEAAPSALAERPATQTTKIALPPPPRPPATLPPPNRATARTTAVNPVVIDDRPTVKNRVG
jgi:NADH dehydrogenase